jgi:hypothetical protein
MFLQDIVLAYLNAKMIINPIFPVVVCQPRSSELQFIWPDCEKWVWMRGGVPRGGDQKV